MKLGTFELDAIYTGDARELAQGIPDESVDLIFTDPVYWNLKDYLWLSELSKRILKPTGNVLAWTGTLYERPCVNALEVYLRYRLSLNYIVTGNTAKSGGHKAFLWRSPLLWFDVGNGQARQWFPDTVVSGNNTNGTHKWNKNPEAISTWMDAFSCVGDIIFDPFTGGGTVPAVCKMLGRHYLAFEIDPATAEKARQRVQHTQPPLFVTMPTQPELFV